MSQLQLAEEELKQVKAVMVLKETGNKQECHRIYMYEPVHEKANNLGL